MRNNFFLAEEKVLFFDTLHSGNANSKEYAMRRRDTDDPFFFFSRTKLVAVAGAYVLSHCAQRFK